VSEVSFARRELQANGCTIRYAEAGTGDAVICFDGILGLRPSPAHALLAARRRVIVIGFPDLAAAESGQPASFIAAVGQALERLGIERFDVMGHGAGALLALSLAVERSDAVNAMALLGAVALPPFAWPTLSGTELKAALHAHPERHPDALPQGEAIAARLAAAQRFVAEGGDALRHRIGALTLPVLALFGTGDPIAPLESADRYRAALADCNLFFVYDAAHAIDIDRPEAVAFMAQEFFERRDLFLVSRENGAAFPR
jgi:pimeloyl-ACP methyl ester carboxylesterase